MATSDDLPIPILEIIIQYVEQDAGWRSAAVLQLVSKSWRAAYRNYPSKVDVDLRQGAPSDVQQLCKLLPNMQELTVNTAHENVILDSISQCSQMTKLVVSALCDLEEFSDETGDILCQGDFDLSCLPASLKQLRLSEVSLGDESIEILRCLHLTKLHCHPLYTSTAAMCSLLVQLRELKVLLQIKANIIFSLHTCISFCNDILQKTYCLGIFN